VRVRSVLVVLLVVSAAGLGLAACNRGGRRDAAAPATTVATGPSTTAAPCGAGRPHAAGQSQETLSFSGKDRTYLLYVPAGYSGAAPVPVVFDFHGYGSNAGQQLVYADFRPLADRDGFVIVAPDGQTGAGGRHFNLFAASGTEQDDVAFTNALLDHVEATLCVDARRVYAAGMSDGGAMSSVLACRDADRFAAVGPVAVILYVPQCDQAARRVAIAGFHGTADPVVPFDGGRVNCCGNATLPGSPASMEKWAAHDGCATPPVDDRLSAMVVRRRWSGCQDGTAVDFYIVEGGGHTWPGAAIDVARLGATTHEISASETLWKFFSEHPMPAR
jgi:polyhydroxybutyrate depolymerase